MVSRGGFLTWLNWGGDCAKTFLAECRRERAPERRGEAAPPASMA